MTDQTTGPTGESKMRAEAIDRQILKTLRQRGHGIVGGIGCPVMDIKGKVSARIATASLKRLEAAGMVVSHRQWKTSFKTGCEGYAGPTRYALTERA